MSDTARLEVIETKLAHLERAVSELSDVVYRQQREIQLALLRNQELKSQLEGLQTLPETNVLSEEKPPHY
ncbi:MAG TPA: SlyX family protein [Steroidobacteraceae bacterium]